MSVLNVPTWWPALDYIEATFWALAYAFVAISGFKNKSLNKLAMPFTSVLLNFAWEVLSLVDLFCGGGIGLQALYIRGIWFILDIPILYLCYKKMNMYTTDKFFKKSFFPTLIVLVLIYAVLYQLPNGILISSFVINLRMEILFFTRRKKLDSTYRVPIAIFKLFGSIFTGIYYSVASPLIPFLIIPAITFDAMYVVYAIKEKRYPEKYPLDDKPEYAELFDKISELRNKKKNTQHASKKK